MKTDAIDKVLFEQLLDYLKRTPTEAERKAFLAQVEDPECPMYGVDSEDPEKIVAVYPDGRRILGAIGSKGFEPDLDVDGDGRSPGTPGQLR